MPRSRTKREEVYLNAGGRCEMCGRPLALDEMTLDHTRAQASFGKGEVHNNIENLACFCGECNAAKADMTPKEFRKFVNTRKSELGRLEAEKKKLERSLKVLTQEYEAKARRIRAQAGELQKEIDGSRFRYVRYLEEQKKGRNDPCPCGSEKTI